MTYVLAAQSFDAADTFRQIVTNPTIGKIILAAAIFWAARIAYDLFVHLKKGQGNDVTSKAITHVVQIAVILAIGFFPEMLASLVGPVQSVFKALADFLGTLF